MSDPWASESGLSRDQLAEALSDVLSASRFTAFEDLRFPSDISARWFNQGWDCDVFEARDPAGQRWLIKLAKRLEVASWLSKEEKLLCDFSDLGFVAAPRLGCSGELELNGDLRLPFIAISEIQGHRLFEALEAIAQGESPINIEAFAQSYGRLIRRVHDLQPPSVEVIEEPQPYPLERLAKHARSVLALADDVLGSGYRAKIEPALDALEGIVLPPVSQVFCHNDLFPEHIFMRAGSSESFALIDWADAAWREPSKDFAIPTLDLGDDFLSPALAAYTDDHALRDQIAKRARLLAAIFGLFDPADAAKNAPNVPGNRRVPRIREMIDAGWLHWSG